MCVLCKWLTKEAIACICWHALFVCISGTVVLYEIGTKLLTTCKDDRLRVWDLKTGSDFSSPKASQQVRHNNNTGRWLTAFKANWIPSSDDHFVVGTFVYES